jgi:hypothetical protein
MDFMHKYEDRNRKLVIKITDRKLNYKTFATDDADPLDMDMLTKSMATLAKHVSTTPSALLPDLMQFIRDHFSGKIMVSKAIYQLHSFLEKRREDWQRRLTAKHEGYVPLCEAEDDQIQNAAKFYGLDDHGLCDEIHMEQLSPSGRQRLLESLNYLGVFAVSYDDCPLDHAGKLQDA